MPKSYAEFINAPRIREWDPLDPDGHVFTIRLPKNLAVLIKEQAHALKISANQLLAAKATAEVHQAIVINFKELRLGTRGSDARVARLLEELAAMHRQLDQQIVLEAELLARHTRPIAELDATPTHQPYRPFKGNT